MAHLHSTGHLAATVDEGTARCEKCRFYFCTIKAIVDRVELAEACRGVADKLETRCSNPQEHLWDCECDAEKPEGR